jgi:outer membrane protein TolC
VKIQTPPPEGIPDGFSVEDVVAEALRRNPSIQAAFRSAEADGEIPVQEVWPPDPTASYSPRVEPVETRLGPMRYSLGIQQAIPLPTKLHLRGKVARHQQEVTRLGYLETVNRVLEETKVALYEIAWIDASLRVTREMRDLLRQMEEVARQKYTTGKATQQDVLKAQIELARTENDLTTLQDDRQRAAARLIALLDRPPETPVGSPAPVEVREEIPDLEVLYEIASETRPDIGAAEAARDRDESRLSLRKEGYLPDLSIGAQYTQIGGGADAWGFSFGFSLPIWVPRIRASIREGEGRLKVSEARLREAEARTYFEVKDNHSRWQTATRRARLYRDTLIQQARQSYRAAEAGYRAGEVDFLDYLDSQRTLLAFRLAYVRARIEAQIRLAALERAVGQSF